MIFKDLLKDCKPLQNYQEVNIFRNTHRRSN